LPASLFKKGLIENLFKKGLIENLFKKGLIENLFKKGLIENEETFEFKELILEPYRRDKTA